MTNTLFYENFKNFIEKTQDRIWRYWVYRQDCVSYKDAYQFDAELQFERPTCYYGIIKEIIEFPNDILIGFQEVVPYDTLEKEADLRYFKLSEIRLAYNVNDQEIFYSV